MTRSDELNSIWIELETIQQRLVLLRTNEERLADFDTSVCDAMDALKGASHHVKTAMDDLTYAPEAAR